MNIMEKYPERVQPEPNSGCWLWVGALSSSNLKKAYGWVHNDGSKLAHRRSYELSCGEIPAGMKVLHKCDNHFFVNPEHLFAGTQKTNVDDCAAKGRRANLSGSSHPRARISDEDVAIIRSVPTPTPYGSIAALIKQFCLSRTQIKSIRSGKSWKK